MSNLRRTLESFIAIIFLALAAASIPMALAQQKPAHSASTKPKSQTKSKPKAVIPTPAMQPLEPEPEVALTRSQLPAVPPRVEYRDGQLAIAAENSTLGDILRAVHQQTGATVDMPANANERVVAHLGPGPAREILARLLDGSNFNYVMLGSPTDATVVQRLIVSAKPSGNGATTEAAPEGPPAMQAAQPRTPFGNNGPYHAGQGDSDESSEPEVQSEEQAEEQSTDEAADDQTENQQQQPGGQQTIKSPEQLLQELQRQQQQQPQRPQAAPQGFPVPPGQVPEQNQPQPEPQ